MVSITRNNPNPFTSTTFRSVVKCFVLFSFFGAINAVSAEALGSSFQSKNDESASKNTQQEESSKQSQEDPKEASVRGKIVIPKRFQSVSFEGMEVVLEEKVQLPALPLPSDFKEMELSKRQEWFQEFQKSEEGKAYRKKVADIQKNRKVLKTKISKSGTFSFKKVPFATYFLQGSKEFDLSGKTFVAGVFGEIPIKDVKHVQLDRMPLEVIRLLAKGDKAPNLRLKVLESGQEQVVKISQFSGRRTLLYFWTMESNRHAKEEMDEVAKAVAQKKLSVAVIGVNLDSPGEKLDKYLKENKFTWNSVSTSGFEEAPVVQDYGISASPSIWLVDGEGKVEMTDENFIQAMSQKETKSLLKVLQEISAGKKVLPPKSATQSK